MKSSGIVLKDLCLHMCLQSSANFAAYAMSVAYVYIFITVACTKPFDSLKEV